MFRRPCHAAPSQSSARLASIQVTSVARTLAVVSAAIFVVVAPAYADTTIGFDDRAPDQALDITNQYASEGILFGTDPFGSTTDGQLFVKALPGAHSAPNVGAIGYGGEIPQSRMWAYFPQARSHVSVFIGTATVGPNPPPTFNAQLEAYDFAGDLLPALTSNADVPQDGSVHTPLSISSATPDISYVTITNGTGAATSDFVIDDLTFDAGSSNPDFALKRNDAGVPVHLDAGRPGVVVPIALHRAGGSTGAIALALSGVPAGVTVTGVPASTTGADGTTFDLSFTAASDAPPADTQVTITGTAADASAGPLGQPRSVAIALTVGGNVDLRAQGIEITQGIQGPGLLVPSGVVNPGVYRGVRLVQGQLTAVRVYADAFGAVAPGITGVGVTLRVLRGATSLGVLLPEQAPAALPASSCACVTQDERVSDANAYTFTLPTAWTTGDISLVATVSPPAPSLSFSPPFTECVGCSADNTYTLTGIHFTPTPRVVIAPVQMLIAGQKPEPDPALVFAQARKVHPGAFRFVVLPYQGTIDVTQLNSSTDASVDKNNAYWGAVRAWDETNTQDPNSYDIAFGVNEQQRGASNWSIYELPLSNPSPNAVAHHGISFGTPGRPLTSIGHELGHNLGDGHASAACGGNGGDWPPDQMGEIEGVGLDLSHVPYRVLYGGLPAEPSEWFDLMSYCVNTDEVPSATNVPDVWISTYNWEHEIDGLELFAARTNQPHDPVQSVLATGPQLLVLAQAVPGGATAIVDTTHLAAGSRVVAGPVSSVFQLVARNAAGVVVATVPMADSLGHGHPGGYFDSLTATVPAAGVASVQVTSGGAVVAERTASAHAPVVAILGPEPGARVGGRGGVLVRFRATDADGGSLSVMLDYSANGGRTYKTVWNGAGSGRVRLPSAYFSASHRARIRIRADDGFNETAAVSKPFVASGSPPDVAVTSPSPGTVVAADGALTLTGTAFDDADRSLSGHALRWSLDGVTLGRGGSVTVAGLPAGSSTVVLTARDRLGRTASAARVVRAVVPPLPWLRLTVPRSIGAHGGVLTLHAASSVPATLTVAGRRTELGRRARAIQVAESSTRRVLLVRLSVSASGVTTPLAYVVRRR